MDFTELNLREKMHEFAKKGVIPNVLKVEMSLMPVVMLLTKPIEMVNTLGTNTVLVSSIYPNLAIEVWNKTGWELSHSLTL